MKRDWLTLAFGIVLVSVVVAVSLHQTITRRRQSIPRDVSSKVESGRSVPGPESAPVPEPAGPAARTTEVRGSARSAAPERTPATASTTAATDGVAILQVQSDVPGASVFIDREFVGATPLTVRALSPGPKQLNVTATGHEGYSSTITLTEGPNRVNVEFLKVSLSAAVPVVHRHAMGSCQGTLTASPKGLAYDASNKTDAFALGFGDIDEFEVDYLKKNLRVRRRAGKTWNFTNDSADTLFVFHRDVNKAREKLGGAR
jgi:hypothetical protein